MDHALASIGRGMVRQVFGSTVIAAAVCVVIAIAGMR